MQHGHVLLGVLDKDLVGPDGQVPQKYQPWFEAGLSRIPCMLVAPVQGGTITSYPLPADEQAVWDLLEGEDQ